MPSKFKTEIRTIQIILRGSRWSSHPEMIAILDEYKRIIDAGNVRSRERRSALQILFSSRAFDSFLELVIILDYRRRRVASPPHFTIGQSINYLRNTGLNGNRMDQRTFNDLDRNVLEKRNKYLHQAGQFPNPVELNRFLSSTLNGLRIISRL